MDQGQFESLLQGRNPLYQSLDCPDGRWAITIPELGSEFDLEGKLRTFSPNDIVIKPGEKLDYESNHLMRMYVEERWEESVQERVAKGFPAPHNGGVIRASQMPFVNSQGKIELHLAQTNYKEHMATNFQNSDASREFVKRHPWYEFSLRLDFNHNANSLTNLGILTTADNYLIYTVRDLGTATFGGTISGFGDNIEFVKQIKENGEANYFFTMLRDSIWRDTGMSKSPRAEEARENLSVELGGYSYLEDGFHVPLFVARTLFEKRDVEEMAKMNPSKIRISDQNNPGKMIDSDKNKYAGISSVAINENSYREFLRNPKLVKTVRPIWTYLAIQKFGWGFLKTV